MQEYRKQGQDTFSCLLLLWHHFSGILLGRAMSKGFLVHISLESCSNGWMQDTRFKKWQCKNSIPSLDIPDQVEQISTCVQKIAIYFHDQSQPPSLQARTHMLSLTRVWCLVYSVKIATHIVIFRIWEAIAMGTDDPNRSWDQITGGFKIKLPFLPIIMWNWLHCVSIGTCRFDDFLQTEVTETRIWYVFHNSLVSNV